MGGMLTVTLPSTEMCEEFGVPPEDVRLLPWDLSGDAPAPDDIDAVLIPHYFLDPNGFRRLGKLPRLRMVQLPSAGYEHALPHLPEGITLCNGRGVHDDETAELAVGLALASLRGIDASVRAMTTGTWDNPLRRSLADRRVMVLGYGSIGHEIAARLEPFKVDLTLVAHTARTEQTPAGPRRVHAVAELPELLPTTEVVIVIMPLTAETRNLVDAAFLARLPDHALLVNVARGGIVDTDALLAELTSGRLAAALDVTRPEPLPADHPLWSAPNVIITPHCGGNTTATDSRTLDLVRRQIDAMVAGRPLENVVSGPGL